MPDLLGGSPAGSEDGREAQAFNESSGVGLALVVQSAGATGIIAFDDDASALEELTDSTGKNLLDDVVERYTPRELRDPGTPAELMQDIQYNGRRYYTGLIFTF